MWKTLVFVNMTTKTPIAEFDYADQSLQYNDAKRAANLYPGMYWEMKSEGVVR